MPSAHTDLDWNFQDVKVIAGDTSHPNPRIGDEADASYKNLVWENLPVPDILFHQDTPAVVSLDIENPFFPKV